LWNVAFRGFLSKGGKRKQKLAFPLELWVEVALSVGKLTEFEPVSLKFKQALI
jgi:hypothetical protein